MAGRLKGASGRAEGKKRKGGGEAKGGLEGNSGRVRGGGGKQAEGGVREGAGKTEGRVREAPAARTARRARGVPAPLHPPRLRVRPLRPRGLLRTRAAFRLARGPLTGDVIWAGLQRRAALSLRAFGWGRFASSGPSAALGHSAPLGPVPSALRGPCSLFSLPSKWEGEDGADLNAVDVVQL